MRDLSYTESSPEGSKVERGLLGAEVEMRGMFEVGAGGHQLEVSE